MIKRWGHFEVPPGPICAYIGLVVAERLSRGLIVPDNEQVTSLICGSCRIGRAYTGIKEPLRAPSPCRHDDESPPGCAAGQPPEGLESEYGVTGD